MEPAPQLRDPHGPDGPRQAAGAVGPDDFADEEEWTPKHQHWWVFAVDPVSHRLEGNARAVFEAVADDPSICKLVLTASVEQKVAGANVVSHQIESVPGQFYLLRAGTIFVNVGPRPTSTIRSPVAGTGSWRCVAARPLAGLRRGAAVPDTEDGREQRRQARPRQRPHLGRRRTSSEVDRAAMSRAVRPGRHLAGG